MGIRETCEILRKLLAQAESFQTVEEFQGALLKEENLEPSFIDALVRDCKSRCAVPGPAFTGMVTFSVKQTLKEVIDNLNNHLGEE